MYDDSNSEIKAGKHFYFVNNSNAINFFTRFNEIIKQMMILSNENKIYQPTSDVTNNVDELHK